MLKFGDEGGEGEEIPCSILKSLSNKLTFIFKN